MLSLSKIVLMTQKVTPYKDSKLGKKEQLTQMFNAISDNYDILNRVISFGIDTKWRKRVVAILNKKNPQNILDIATGTGDLAISLVKTNARQITGIDISVSMLEIGKRKVTKNKLDTTITMVLGDGEKLPFKNTTFDAVTVAFGVRNFEDLEQGLIEIYRVLKPTGTLVILETSIPAKTPFKQIYNFYTKYILPKIGKLFSKDNAAYTYLSESAAVFPYGEDFNNILRKTGFIAIENRPQTFGVASIYIATKSKS